MVRHDFGGLWTREKLSILEDYLKFYSTALKNKPFTLHYVDAFAGTGSQTQRLLDGQCLLIPEEDFKGSARIALSTEQPFHHYHFNDLSEEHCKALEGIRVEYPDRRVSISNMDANQFVVNFCQAMSRTDRAVIFLDPYSTELDWATIECAAKTGKVDLWLLFPLSATLRMAANDKTRIYPALEAKLDRLLGTKEWAEALYRPVEKPLIQDLFGDPPGDQSERLNSKEVASFVCNRLRSIFSYVAEPVTLKVNNNPFFLFIFAVSNPAKTAKDLAEKVSKQILRKHVR